MSPKIDLLLLKDIFYLIGSCLAIITFVITTKKRDKSIFAYRTEMGNESRPMLFCIRGDVYNLKIFNHDKSFYVYKLPITFKFSSVRRNDYDPNDFDESSFYALLKQGEALLIHNDRLDLSMKIEFEDQYRNRYYQSFNLVKDQIGNPDRFIKGRSQSLYSLSKRWKRLWFLWY